MTKGLTPMMQQYHQMRQTLPQDVLLLFRLGDFYELFFEDAKEAATILDVALTKRNHVPMCGVPHHAAEAYIHKLIKADKRVALAEQIGTPQPGKLVEREITQIISVGTINNSNLLEANKNNYIASTFFQDKRYGLAYVDHTTGEFRVTEFSNRQELQDELARISPAEHICSEEQRDVFTGGFDYDGYTFLFDQALHLLKEHFRVHSLDGYGCKDMPAAICAAGGLLHYLSQELRQRVEHIHTLKTYYPGEYVLIDQASQSNLELVNSHAGKKHTLLHALDRTKTAMGGRKLHHWILHPLRNLDTLKARQTFIGAFLEEPFLLGQCQELLKEVRDIERTLSRLSQSAGNARDLQALSQSLLLIPEIKEHLQALSTQTTLITDLLHQLNPLPQVVDLLKKALVEEPPATIKEGGIFKEGFSTELDALRQASREGKQWISDLQIGEMERTGIKSLKVRFNSVFGYYIEVTKPNLHLVPENYTRKQTTANAERFITPELKEMENRILGADERAKHLEYEKFGELREQVLQYIQEMQETADALAMIDVIVSLAETARLYHYCKPELNESKNLFIEEGKHPVLDQTLTEEKFVPNSTKLDDKENKLLIVTGPNMAGKSTYIRQVALLTLMAQIGSYIPAKRAEIGLTDRIFTRVGASDDLARGQSTFMVEMNETALIVNTATESSLVILDEIGRGTSTFDGLSIAWSVAEHLHDAIGARTLFATHYHEMTALSETHKGIKNYNIAIREWNDQIIFLRTIVPGPADKSYGIQVARLAGLPDSIINRSKNILNHLEKNAQTPSEESPQKPKKSTKKKEGKSSPQMTLFS